MTRPGRRKQISPVFLIWTCAGLAKYGRTGAERRAAGSKGKFEVTTCDECRWYHLLPTRVKLPRL